MGDKATRPGPKKAAGRRVGGGGGVEAILPPFSQLSAAAVYAASVRQAAGLLFHLSVSNSGAAAAFLRVYDQATVPGAGDAANIIYRAVVPVGQTLVVPLDVPMRFAAGLGVRVTGASADNDATALAAGQCGVNVGAA